MPSSALMAREILELLGYCAGTIAPEEVRATFIERLRGLRETNLIVLERYEDLVYKEGIPRELITEEALPISA